MNVEFTLDIDDIVAYNLYYYAASPQMKVRKKKRRVSWGVSSLILVLLGILNVALIEVVFGIVFFAAAAFLISFYFINNSRIPKRIYKEVVRRYGQGPGDVFGKHNFIISDDRFVDITDSGESSTKWEDVEKIDTTDRYLFIMLYSLAQSYIIPRRAFSDDVAFTRFADTVKAFHEAHPVDTLGC